MATRVTIAKNGRAFFLILLPENADRILNFAAAELKKYLEKMTYAKFYIYNEKQRNIFIERGKLLLSQFQNSLQTHPGLRHPSGGGDHNLLLPKRQGPLLWRGAQGAGWTSERVLKSPLLISLNSSVNDDLPLSGAKFPCFDEFKLRMAEEKISIWGCNSRSVLYGVYAFLERLGCRFVEPGIEVVPSLPTLTVEAGEIREKSSFPLRNIFRETVAKFRETDANKKIFQFDFLDPEKHVAQIDWMAKRRLNHYEFYVDFYRYDLWEKHKHSVLQALLDRGFEIEVTHHSIHYFCPPDENHDFGGYGPETYQRNRQEWYLPAFECGSRGRWQTRIEIHEVQEIIIKRLLEYSRRNPEVGIIGLWPDDIPMNKPYKNLSVTDGYMKFWNLAGDVLARELSGKKLAVIAYFDLKTPPKNVIPRQNLHCWFCPMEENYMYPIENKRNRVFLNDLEGWIKAMPSHQVGIFEYYGWSTPMTPFREKMKRDLIKYGEIGLGGMYAWCGYTYNILGQDYRWALDLYVLTHLLWRPHANLQTHEEDWANAVFGNAATYVLEFYDFLKKAHAKEAKNGLIDRHPWADLETLHKAQAILAVARTKAVSPVGKRRVDLLEKTLANSCSEKIRRRNSSVGEVDF